MGGVQLSTGKRTWNGKNSTTSFAITAWQRNRDPGPGNGNRRSEQHRQTDAMSQSGGVAEAWVATILTPIPTKSNGVNPPAPITDPHHPGGVPVWRAGGTVKSDRS
jgi:hypothetical protein